MRTETVSTVCQCGHEKAVHHDELGCCSCECRKFVLPVTFACVVCGESFEEREKLEAHFTEYKVRKE